MGHFIQDVPVQVSSSKPKEIPYSPEQAFALRQRLALVQAIRVFLQEVYLWNKEKQKTEKKSFRDTWNTLGSKLQSYNLNESTLTDLQHEIERLTAGDPLNQRIHTTDAIETAAFESLKGAVPLMPPVANKAIPRVIGFLGDLNRVIDQQSPHDQEKNSCQHAFYPRWIVARRKTAPLRSRIGLRGVTVAVCLKIPRIFHESLSSSP
jgi:hypothetical protein